MEISVVVGIVVGLAAYILLFKLIFPNDGDFKEAFYYYFKPDLLSMIDGEYSKDVSKSFRLGIWLVSGAAIGIVTAAVLFQIIS